MDFRAITIMAKCLEKKRQVKLALAAKFDRLARCAGGIPKRDTWLFHARRFRNQAEAIAQQIAFKAASK